TTGLLNKVPSMTMLLICPIIVLYSCNSKNKEKITSVEKFPVITPIKKDTVISEEFVADIQSLKNVELRTRARGYIEKIYVDEGQFVKKGQLLFSINSKEFTTELQKTKAQLASNTAELSSAITEYRNTKILVDKKILSPSELALAQAKVDVLKASINESKANITTSNINLSYTNIRAPFDGIINRIPNKQGSLVDEGTLLTTISDNSSVYAYFNVSEKEFLDLNESNILNRENKVSLLLANNKALNHLGKIETVLSELDDSTGTVTLRAKFSNSEGLLKHGSSAKIILPISVNNAILIPQKSTYEVQEKNYVYTITSKGTTQSKEITILHRIPNFYIVESNNLNSSDNIIYEGVQSLQEGDKIIPEKLSWNKIMTQLKNN
ncbi:efflux RND transporter periplasmic adaptor subunit, partial [Chryseobacterium sp.]|uniref:efflux RND transporter periplasmic adaptor subunit n=1 Tax=Chryseobacterium sp. TaxID=1871047 RepID=UPI0025BA96A1